MIVLGILGDLFDGVPGGGRKDAIQAIAQKDAIPAHAAIIFGTEGVFAALAGWLFIGETLTWHAIGGCGLVVLGCVFAQIAPARRLMSGNSQASTPISGK